MPTLTWDGKEEAVVAAAQVSYHLLEEDAALGYGDADAGNVIVQGDNLAALKALLPYYKGRVRCIYADPPYNTGSAFEHYDDNVEHSTWLSLMYPRLELMREFLAEDGSIWISIDDDEGHYLKVLCDEIFGRDKFIATIVWQKRYSRENRKAIGDSHDFVLVYAENPETFKESRNFLPLTEKQKKLYKNPDNDERGPWQSVSLLAQGYRPNQMYEITAPNGKKHLPPAGNCWKVIEPEYQKLIDDNRVSFGSDGNGVPRRKEFLSKAKGLVPWTWWTHEECGHNDEAKKETNVLFGADHPFETPKPERLLQRIIHISTNPGDLVLDAFLGSGTTAAVAQKMNRRYIGIEMGDHAVTHVVPRLQKVIDGEQGGISQAEKWQGGGGFQFFRLGEPLFDALGRIRQDVSFHDLAAHIWRSETGLSYHGDDATPLLGIHDGVAYYLLYNGILKDKKPQSGNALTRMTLALLPTFEGPKVVYGTSCILGAATMEAAQVTFKKIPTQVPA